MSPPTKSEIWRYFKVIDVDSAKCNSCGKIYSRKGRTTTSLKNHLRSIHPEEYIIFEKAEQEQKNKTIKISEATLKTPRQEAKKQISLQESMQKSKQWDKNDSRSQNIDNRIGEMIALQDLPFNFVEGIGFRRLMHTVAPQYNLNGRTYFTAHVCNILYEKVAKAVQLLVNDLEYMAFTTDIWSEPSANVSLLSLTCHGITRNFTRLAIVLKCETFDGRHTGDIIAEKFEAMLNEWNILKQQVHCMIRDEGSNMKRAMLLSSLIDIDCTAHKIQIAVRTGVNSSQKLLDLVNKCKQIARHFSHSTIAQDQLKKIQERLTQPVLNVLQDCTTRWNSTFYMFERFLKIKDALCLYANEKPITPLVPDEWMLMESCVELLKPFEDATRELSSSHAMISSVIPIIYTLRKNIDEQLAAAEGDNTMKIIITAVKNELINKFGDLENEFIYTIATYLDPRYKHKFFSVILTEKIEAEILTLCKCNSEKDECENPEKRLRSSSLSPSRSSDSHPSASTSQESIPTHKSSLQSNLAMILDSSSEDEATPSPTSDLIIKSQLKLYSKEKRIHVTQNPLEWWQNKPQLYGISGLARRYLSPPPASVPSEQLFSSAGIIYEPLRNRLHGEKAAKLLFLKYNLRLLNFNY